MLVLRDLPRLKRILTDASHSVQLVFAGKAHLPDDAGKELIRQVTELSRNRSSDGSSFWKTAIWPLPDTCCEARMSG
jgi:glucan phosphorylase